jgi:hypothetical protein
MHGRDTRGGDALDLLESEDLELRRLFTGLRLKRGPSVEERAEYGDLAKESIRHLAVREAALVDVAGLTGGNPLLRELGERFQSNLELRRPAIDRVERMSRGVQGINLRVGQDFDGEMQQLMQIVGTEIEWELGVAIPALKGALVHTEGRDRLKSAVHLRHHAPTNLDPHRSRWRERGPVVSWLLTWYDHLRDFPRETLRGR